MALLVRPIRSQAFGLGIWAAGDVSDSALSFRRTPVVGSRKILGEQSGPWHEAKSGVCDKFRTYVRSERETL